MNDVCPMIVPGSSLLTVKTTMPRSDPRYKVICAAFADARFQKMPNKKTVLMGGAMCAITSLIPLNKLPYLLSIGNNAIDTNNAIPADILPICTSFLSFVFG